MKKSPIRLAVLAMALLSAGASQAAGYTVKFLDTLDVPLGKSNIGTSMNNAGQVTGFFATGLSYWPYDSGGTHAALWNGAGLTDLTPDHEFDSVGISINNSGHVVGWVQEDISHFKAALWDSHGLTMLSTPAPNTQSVANAINDSGTIVGIVNYGQAYKWVGGVGSALPVPGATFAMAEGINDSDVAVGYATLSGVTHPVRWDGAVATVLDLAPGDQSAYASRINNAGQIIGAGVGVDGSTHAEIWTAAGVQVIGRAGSAASGINAAGQVVGYVDDPNRGYFAALWNGTTEVDLNQYLDPALRAAGWRLDTASAINDKGQILANATNYDEGDWSGYPSKPVILTINAVPEPETYGMLLGGLAVMGVIARRLKAA